jgi:hypothetical protein
MKVISLVLISLLFFSCSKKEKTPKKVVVLLPQWHLLSGTKTNDIEKSKTLPQYTNQKSIYLILEEWLSSQKLDLVVSEGCEGEIDDKFADNFNGWAYPDLNSKKNSEDYAEILTLIALKTEVKFPQVRTLCGDNMDLIKKHQLVFSDLSGSIGFLSRLKEAREKNDEIAYVRYKDALVEVEKRELPEPEVFLTAKVKNLFESEEKILNERNMSFVKTIDNSNATMIAVVIGARHIAGLQKELVQRGYEVLIPEVLYETLPSGDEINNIKALIQ